MKTRSIITLVLVALMATLFLPSCSQKTEKNPTKIISKSEKDGIIYLSISATSLTNKEWKKYFKRQNYETNTDLLRYVPLGDVMNNDTIHICIVRGSLFAKDPLNREEIFDKPEIKHEYGACMPDIELGCFLRDLFNDKDLQEMGLAQIVIMHDPELITDEDGDLCCWSNLVVNQEYYDPEQSKIISSGLNHMKLQENKYYRNPLLTEGETGFAVQYWE